MSRIRLTIALSLPIVAACGSHASALDPTDAALPPEITAAVTAALQDEYHAEQTYRRVMADFGTVLPFANIVTAEQRHAAALAGLLTSRGIDLPPSAWNLDNVPRFPTVAAACAVAADAEIENIALYDRLLTLELPSTVRTIFANNRRASLEKHLPAFTRCR